MRLLGLGDKPAAALARELGVPRNRLYKWRAEADANGYATFPGTGLRPESVAKLERLKRESARFKEPIEIFKKSARCFVKSSG